MLDFKMWLREHDDDDDDDDDDDEYGPSIRDIADALNGAIETLEAMAKQPGAEIKTQSNEDPNVGNMIQIKKKHGYFFNWEWNVKLRMSYGGSADPISLSFDLVSKSDDDQIIFDDYKDSMRPIWDEEEVEVWCSDMLPEFLTSDSNYIKIRETCHLVGALMSGNNRVFKMLEKLSKDKLIEMRGLLGEKDVQKLDKTFIDKISKALNLTLILHDKSEIELPEYD